eukprot:16023069-Heterocapsa_arctica.AAC.1
MAEPNFYHWFTQYKPSKWEPWLLALPDYGYTEHWTKLQWCNWYFQCWLRKQYLDHLVLGSAMASIVLDDNER